MKKKRAIIGHEMEAKYNHKLKKTSFVSILEYIMTKKKKSMILKTIDEFQEICLIKKSLAGIIKYANKRQKKHININKALTHYKKVKRNREELKKMIDEFNIKEYGSDRVICINQQSINEETVLLQKTFGGWKSITKRIRTERQIIERFRQFHNRIQLTNIFLIWAEKFRRTSTKLSLEINSMQ